MSLLGCFLTPSQFKRDKKNLNEVSRFVSEPCLWFRHAIPRSPSDNLANASYSSESHPDFFEVNNSNQFSSSFDQVSKLKSNLSTPCTRCRKCNLAGTIYEQYFSPACSCICVRLPTIYDVITPSSTIEIELLKL